MVQSAPNGTEYILESRNLDIFYGNFKAVTDVNMKLAGIQRATRCVAFQLDQVDPVGGKTAKRLVEGSWNVADPEKE